MSFIVPCAYKTEANSYAKHHQILHIPPFSCIQITRIARNPEYMLNVDNTLQNHIILTRVPWLLLDLSLDPNSFSLLNQ
jgi:hypothetical protein